VLRTSLAAAMAVLVVTACGGDEDSAPAPQTTPPPETTTVEQVETSSDEADPGMTHEEFVSELDAWCKAGNAEAEQRFGAAVEDASDASDYDGLADALEERQEWAAEEQERMPVQEEDLSEEDAEAFGHYLAVTARIEGLLDRFIKALRERDDDEINRLSDLVEQARNERTNLTVDMGLSECGS
jgi:hypothetical protein